MNIKTKERLEARELDDKQYFIYYTGETEYDEMHGIGTRSEVREQLDSEFNMHIMDTSRKNAKKELKELLERDFFKDKELFIGEQAPEKRLYDPCDDIEYFAPQKRPNIVGIWMKATKEEKEKYFRLLVKQNFEKTKKRIL